VDSFQGAVLVSDDGERNALEVAEAVAIDRLDAGEEAVVTHIALDCV
jgi:hypothetical protein